MSNAFTENLDRSRKELLDMGIRGNTLLHFKSNAKSLDLSTGDSEELLNALLQAGKSIDVLAVDQSTRKQHSLKSEFEDEKLDLRLRKIHGQAKTFIEERGVNTLYLAIGFVEWYESSSSEISRLAPLVLVPVNVIRSNVKDRYKLEYSGEDIGPNLTLIEKFKSEFSLTLPSFDDDLDLSDYLEKVEEVISGQSRWKVQGSKVALGFFSFGKFQMYRDLDPESWLGEMEKNEVLQALFSHDGFSHDASSNDLSDKTHLDEYPASEDLIVVKDADSSQMKAMLKIKSGSNLIIQGPPGTGKSQTITNIIADCLASGKKVLFVAEKMAALEVVKRRLDDCELGDAVLELHSHKSNKKGFVQELNRILHSYEPSVKKFTSELKEYNTLKSELNAYSSAVNSSVGKSEVSFIDALGHYDRLKKDASGYDVYKKYQFNWTKDEYHERLSKVRECEAYLAEHGSSKFNLFEHSSLRIFSPASESSLISAINKSTRSADQLKVEWTKLSDSVTTVTDDCTIGMIEDAITCLQLAMEAPDLSGCNIKDASWLHKSRLIHKALSEIGETFKLRKEYDDILIPSAWKQDVFKIRTNYKSHSKKFWRFLIKGWREAKAEFSGLCRDSIHKNPLACCDAILKYQELQERLTKYKEHFKSIFDTEFDSEDNLDKKLEQAEFLVTVYESIANKNCSNYVLAILEKGFSELELNELKETLGNAKSVYVKSLSEVDKIAGFTDETLIDALGGNISDISTKIEQMKEHVTELHAVVRSNVLCDDLISMGLEWISPIFKTWGVAARDFLIIFEFSYYSSLTDRAYKKQKPLNKFDMTGHQRRIKRFCALDSKLMVCNSHMLARKHWEKLPSINNPGQMATLRKEANKKARHIPIRKLLTEAGDVILDIKPIFMMSPMSIATYLEPNSVKFDIVIFDEASQVKTIDSFGAIARGKQVIVVGDDKQMPPTSFFDKSLTLDDDEAAESETADMESILKLFSAKNCSETMLRWHYRSRHHSLISVSNDSFYNNELVVFPSAGGDPLAKGLSLVHNPESVYDKGNSRTNKGEAKQIALAVMDHARSHPDISLGVVAFSMAQRDAIEDELELIRREDNSLETFFSENNSEPFFIKNLENVQGDERAVIFISIGYGRDQNGQLGVSFGPLNREGGERRLNVLISRARLEMKVFSNFKGDELDIRKTQSLAVKCLQKFLMYAETKQLNVNNSTGKETDSPFEDQVIYELQKKGYDVEPQVGCSGFFIDIGVRYPDRPGSYMLGVECDGASYHSSRSARDRDRLRQEVLEGLGWNIHRIWSTDWFRSREKEVDKMVAVLEKISQYPDKNMNTKSQHQKNDIPKLARVEKTAQESRSSKRLPKYKKYEEFAVLYSDIEENSLTSVVTVLSDAVTVEAPIHETVLLKRLVEAAAISRAGARVKAVYETALIKGITKNKFILKGDFIYSSDKDTVVKLRDWSDTNMTIEMVSDEELILAIKEILKVSYDATAVEVYTAAVKLLGFNRVTAKYKERLEDLFQQAKV